MTPLRLVLPVLAAVVLLVASGCGGAEGIEGTGYSYETPEGWAKASEEQAEVFPLADSIVLDEEGEDEDFVTNINVIASGPAGPDVDLEAEAQASIEALQSQPETFGLPAGTEVTVTAEPSEATLDGADAVTYDFETDVGSQVLLQRQLLAVSPDGGGYSITASSESDLEGRDAALDEVLASWAWE